MTIQTIKIDPATAQQMLQMNTRNRAVNPRHVTRLATEMKLGRWAMNGDAIRFSGDTLLDGQHRLMAVVESGATIDTLVIRELPSTVFHTIDCGRPRTMADTLTVRGEAKTRDLAATLALVERYKTGRITWGLKFTNTEIESLLTKYPGVRASVLVAHETKRLIPNSVLAAAHYLFSERDPVAAGKFASDLIGGHGLSPDDPVYLLRERLVRNASSKARLPREYILALAIKAWNFRRTGVHIRCLKFRSDGISSEAFPSVL